MGKKYIEQFKLNTMTLEQILYKIKIENNESYYYELVRDLDVYRIINKIASKYSFQAKSCLMSWDIVRGIVETELMILTWKNYKFNYDENNIKDGYLAFIYKYLPLRVKREISKERPGYKTPKQVVDEYFTEKDKKEDGDWIENDYRYTEILSGGINDLEIISDELQMNNFNNVYKNEFNDMEDDWRFEDLINCLNENQKDILKKIFKSKYTESEIAKENNISQQGIHKIKKKAIKNLKNNLVVKF